MFLVKSYKAINDHSCIVSHMKSKTDEMRNNIINIALITGWKFIYHFCACACMYACVRACVFRVYMFVCVSTCLSVPRACITLLCALFKAGIRD